MNERKSFPGSVTHLPEQGLSEHGLMVDTVKPVDKTRELHLLFSLSLPEDAQKQLEALVAAGKTVAPGDLRAKYMPDEKNVALLAGWLSKQGYTITKVSPNGTGIYATAPIALIEQSLQVSFLNVTKNGLTYAASKDAPSLPAEVAQSVQAIVGLQPYHHPAKHGRAAASAATGKSPYMVNQILKAYNADGLGVTGAGQTIAILIDTFPNDADLTQFWSQNNLPVTLSQVQKINVGNGVLPAPEGEETLDVEWASGIAPGATIRIYAAGSLQYTQLDQALDAILSDVQTIPGMRQLSISLGYGETYMGGPEGIVAAVHQKFLRLASAGVNIFVSAGDAGSNPDANGQMPIGPTQVEYAASDTSVIAVGGTTLVLAPDGSITSEIGWYSGGGGISALFDRPAWQACNGVATGTKRLVPDVSLSADPTQGGFIVFNGKVLQYGGTSWAAPVWAAFCALINEARHKAGKPFVAFLNPLIYPLAGTGCFRDITDGCNGAYSAAKGYDMVTGIGVPDMKALVKALVNSAKLY